MLRIALYIVPKQYPPRHEVISVETHYRGPGRLILKNTRTSWNRPFGVKSDDLVTMIEFKYVVIGRNHVVTHYETNPSEPKMAEVKLPKPGITINPEDMAEMAFEVKEPHIKKYVEEWCKKHGVKCDTVAWHNWIVIKGLGGYLRQAAESWAKDQLVFFEDVHVWCDRAWPFDRLMKVPCPTNDENEKAQKALIDYHCRLMGNNYFWMALDYAQGQGWETKWIQEKDNPRHGYIDNFHHGCGGRIKELKTDYVCTLGCSKCGEEWRI